MADVCPNRLNSLVDRGQAGCRDIKKREGPASQPSVKRSNILLGMISPEQQLVMTVVLQPLVFTLHSLALPGWRPFCAGFDSIPLSCGCAWTKRHCYQALLRLLRARWRTCPSQRPLDAGAPGLSILDTQQTLHNRHWILLLCIFFVAKPRFVGN